MLKVSVHADHTAMPETASFLTASSRLLALSERTTTLLQRLDGEVARARVGAGLMQEPFRRLHEAPEPR